uniref:Uncharacterized protein n=1 Tax=Avena sativa TaxID=4498 RepID=A0ACD5TBW3_AVESA
MRPMFESWMVEHGRRYESEEETTMRYREFKRNVKDVDRANALGGGKAVFGLNHLSDSTQAESRVRGGGCRDLTPAEDLMFWLGCDAVCLPAVKWWTQRRGD